MRSGTSRGGLRRGKLHFFPYLNAQRKPPRSLQTVSFVPMRPFEWVSPSGAAAARCFARIGSALERASSHEFVTLTLVLFDFSNSLPHTRVVITERRHAHAA